MSSTTRMVLLFLITSLCWPIALACFALVMITREEEVQGFHEMFLFLVTIAIGIFFGMAGTYSSLELRPAIRKWYEETKD